MNYGYAHDSKTHGNSCGKYVGAFNLITYMTWLSKCSDKVMNQSPTILSSLNQLVQDLRPLQSVNPYENYRIPTRSDHREGPEGKWT